MSSCSGSPTPDRCIKETNSGVVTFACDLASNINGSVTDNACSTINSVEICICSTDGCNEPLGNFVWTIDKKKDKRNLEITFQNNIC